jgi:hypothetical protein
MRNEEEGIERGARGAGGGRGGRIVIVSPFYFYSGFVWAIFNGRELGHTCSLVRLSVSLLNFSSQSL